MIALSPVLWYYWISKGFFSPLPYYLFSSVKVLWDGWKAIKVLQCDCSLKMASFQMKKWANFQAADFNVIRMLKLFSFIPNSLSKKKVQSSLKRWCRSQLSGIDLNLYHWVKTLNRAVRNSMYEMLCAPFTATAAVWSGAIWLIHATQRSWQQLCYSGPFLC